MNEDKSEDKSEDHQKIIWEWNGEWFIFGYGWNGLRMTSDFGLRGGDDWPVQCLPHQSVSGGGGRQVGAVEVMTFC